MVNAATLNNEHFTVQLDKLPSREESANADFMRKIVFDKVLTASLVPFQDALFGGQQAVDVRIGSLNDVKKIPELQEFDEALKLLKPALKITNCKVLKR